jgi:hypothetical protein
MVHLQIFPLLVLPVGLPFSVPMSSLTFIHFVRSALLDFFAAGARFVFLFSYPLGEKITIRSIDTMGKK